MNILFVSAVLPYPLHSGGQTRMYHLLRMLSKRHRITLASFIRSESEREHISKLSFLADVRMVMRGRAWQPKYYFSAITGAYPFLLSTYDNEHMRSLLADLVTQRFDVMHLEPFYVWPSIPEHALPLVISEHNVEYEVYASYAEKLPFPALRPFFRWDVEKLKQWERLAWRKAHKLTAVSATDASVMESYVSHSVDIVPNGVDISSFPYRKPSISDHPVLLFAGNFRWHPNTEAADALVDRVYPAVRSVVPEAKLRIVGKDIPVPLSKRVKAAGGSVGDHVDDIAVEYRRADILVAPHAIGGGTKFKMLEAMASGLPVVTTRHGIAGLAAKPGVHYMEAETVREFAEAVQKLTARPETAVRLTTNARNLVESRYDWRNIAKTLENVWKNAHEQH